MPDAQAGGGLRIAPPVAVELAATRGGFLVYGPFERGEHTLVLEQGTPTLDGGRFHRQARLEFEIPLLEPRIAFIGQGRYLPRTALERLGLRTATCRACACACGTCPPRTWPDTCPKRATGSTSSTWRPRIRGPPKARAAGAGATVSRPRWPLACCSPGLVIVASS